MDLIPCSEDGRHILANLIEDFFNSDHRQLKDDAQKQVNYVAKTFPNILPDLAHIVIERATQGARTSNSSPETVNRNQLVPYFMFSHFLGKCPQVNGLMYSYFETSSFQPLPENMFTVYDQEERVEYLTPGFSDELLQDILSCYLKYLTFNPKWFSSVWNWTELGRILTHTDAFLRYLAANCLSIITRPTRIQHMSLLRDLIEDPRVLVDTQIKHRDIFDNTFRPYIETNQSIALDYANSFGSSGSVYAFNKEISAKFVNVLLSKRDLKLSDELIMKQRRAADLYVPIQTLNDSISQLAYSISIGKPCVIRGPPGSGKTSILDFIAHQTNRLDPPEYVKIQVSDQLDSKLIIGSYVCTEVPGQFEWQPGPLTRALAYGAWILFEDIDTAPQEILQVIHSVIENGSLSSIPGCPIKLENTHPDFRIFFTQQTRGNSLVEHGLALGFDFVERLSDIVQLPEMKNKDLEEIIDARYKLGSLTSTILKLYNSALDLKSLTEIKTTREISMRDLFKFCDRVSMMKLDPSDKISTNDLESILLDAVDCFAAYLAGDYLAAISTQFGEMIGISAERCEGLIVQRKPEPKETNSLFRIGRISLEPFADGATKTLRTKINLAYNRQSLQLLERMSACVKTHEPVLLVGETGVGKTATVQYLADVMKTELVVINLSQQSDSSDLLGGYRPVELKEVMRPLHSEFEDLFTATFDVHSNKNFLERVNECHFKASKAPEWSLYLKLVSRLCAKALDIPLSQKLLDRWNNLSRKNRSLTKLLQKGDESSSMALRFTDGSFLKAVKEGSWILLDEINLAEPDILQSLILILDSLKESKIYMLNFNDSQDAIRIHKNFRVFACMNPSTDVGKRDLTDGMRSRFTEFFVNDNLDKGDLRLIVESYVKSSLSNRHVQELVNFYSEIREKSHTLSDISGNQPIYSLRTLCRALSICADNVCNNMEKSLFESLRITFFQQLNTSSAEQVMKMIMTTIFHSESSKSLPHVHLSCPKNDNHVYVEVEGFWIQKSNLEPCSDPKYILTKSVKSNLQSLARIVSLGQRRLPILIQGNTSVGKTSLIKYMASLTGNKCYRINNHEHTDLQDYVGKHILKENGELIFQEGLLVRAMRRGYWIILDELNLASSELLEALNRVLDDNRELFIPETGESVKAHSKFMLFATQNPPEEYAGRKLLSRAFRNRFIELHFDDIPKDELQHILHKRCEMPEQYAKKIVTVMKELQLHRGESGCFTGKNSFMTMRDLFRWGERYRTFKSDVPSNELFDWDHFVASEGLILLEGRARTLNEADIVKEVIERVFKKTLDRNEIYGRTFFKASDLPPQFKHIHVTTEFQRTFLQLEHALKYKEPVLLCGQTGCGKTTACQLYAHLAHRQFHTYNCHQNTESSDFIGSIRPSRQGDQDCPEATNHSSRSNIFVWVDGPLVEAMKLGAILLIDEISLADDAVLERINSVLEPSRRLTLAEKDGKEIEAVDGFRLVATMNPGGDYGKKELSHALRNRFTEIYCHSTSDVDQICRIIESSLSPALLKPKIAPLVLQVMREFLRDYYQGCELISIRDVLSWCKFLNVVIQSSSPKPLSVQEALFHGASLVFFDQFGTCGHHLTRNVGPDQRATLRRKLLKYLSEAFGSIPEHPAPAEPQLTKSQKCQIKFGKFYLNKGPHVIHEKTLREFIIQAPTVKRNLIKIVRAMQLDRPILLEGDPGAGKTSIIESLAKLTGHKLVRINLSQQTDISDLIGTDLPDNTGGDDDSPKFCWHDGPMLRAIKSSDWVLLDEMNLASQSVLEGLNACFDHRGEIFIAELNRRIPINRYQTRVFACQNPYSQGAARKGLPQSFLNRFTSIHIESHSSEDLRLIVTNLFPSLPTHLVPSIVAFNAQASDIVQGYDFNLRDIIYWCELMTRNIGSKQVDSVVDELYQPERFVQFAYLDRLRSPAQRAEITDIFASIFNKSLYEPAYREIRLGEEHFIISRSILPRNLRLHPHLSELCILKYQIPYMESIAKAIEHNKMPILVGEHGVGKRSMVKIIAGLTGNQLNILGSNKDMDTLELLGSFEQKSFQRRILDLISESKSFVTSMINGICHKRSAETWTKVFNGIWTTLYASSTREIGSSNFELLDSFRIQLSLLRNLIKQVQPLSTLQRSEKCSELIEKINLLMSKTSFESDSICSSGAFEWIDSLLIDSIRQGAWLMIENANLLDPATLDRLNSLVEPNGKISLNEKGSGPDGIEMISPHPNFRLILTMNPENGELSRAMRNRGIEIFVQPRFFFEDFLILLDQNGFKPEDAATSGIMQVSYETHKKITGTEAPEDEEYSLLAFFGLNYIPILTHQVRRGFSTINDILTNLLISYYHHKGFAHECSQTDLRPFISNKIEELAKPRDYAMIDMNWLHFQHDLVSLSGGDAVPTMVSRDLKILYDDGMSMVEHLNSISCGLEHVDIVNSTLAVRLFLELSSHGDFECRLAFIQELFKKIPSFSAIITAQTKSLYEFIPLIHSLLPERSPIAISEIPIDSRNAPDIHNILRSVDKASIDNLACIQNWWILSMHKMMLNVIVKLIEDRMKDLDSLWTVSEGVRSGEISRESLLRPVAEIASDLYDLLDGLLKVVSNRCLDDRTTARMLPRLFWLHNFMCRLKKGCPKEGLITLCNQLPMLWALTYQKVIAPMIKDCNLADINYNGRKFSSRIQQICEFLDVTLSKPSKIEKEYHQKVVNLSVRTSKRCNDLEREVSRFFATLVGRYHARQGPEKDGESENAELYGAAGIIWSNSNYMKSLYDIEEKLIICERPDRSSETDSVFLEAQAMLNRVRSDYEKFDSFKPEMIKDNRQYAVVLSNPTRKRNALDQFAPVWQLKFINARAHMLLPSIENPGNCANSIKQMLMHVNGVTMSPRYYATLTSYLSALKNRRMGSVNQDPVDDDSVAKENIDLYGAILADHFPDNIVLDNQVVGWIKFRVTTTDLASMAPLLPEYSPMIAMVGAYSLDISHLKLNSHLNTNPQLNAMIVYLWRHYLTDKLGKQRDAFDLDLARNLIHMRMQVGKYRDELVGPSYRCRIDSEEKQCFCIDEYIRHRLSSFDEIVQLLRNKALDDDVDIILKFIRMLYFGHFNCLEYAPIFTIDPSIRSREKLDVYGAELAHIKLDLYFRNMLFYWRTGENLQLNEIEPEDASSFPFIIRILVERRNKLEHSIKKLRREQANRPLTDDGSQYGELRKRVEVDLQRNDQIVRILVKDLIDYLHCKDLATNGKFSNMLTRCKTQIKSIDRTVSQLRSDFSNHADILTNYILGLCFMKQGLRCLYSRFEQRMQIMELGNANISVSQYSQDIMRVFSFNNFSHGNIKSVVDKLRFLKRSKLLEGIPSECDTKIRSTILKTVLIQLHHHIALTPSDIEKCTPIVKQISKLFHDNWLRKKNSLEEERRKREELYQYKATSTSIGNEISFEHREFLDISSRFPTYEHAFEKFISIPPGTSDEQNLKTEAKLTSLSKRVDLTVCIDICKAYYKFMLQASRNLLGPKQANDDDDESDEPLVDLDQFIKLEAETLYSLIRSRILELHGDFEPICLECHLLQANNLKTTLAKLDYSLRSNSSSLKSSIEFLDEKVYDIYHDQNAYEALRLQDFMYKLDKRVCDLLDSGKYDKHPTLIDLLKLNSKIGSFLLTDPLMKFVTGAHALLGKIEEWSRSTPTKQDKLIEETEILIELIEGWRAIEVQTWHNCLHRTKRNYIDSTICDLWFELYYAFNKPIQFIKKEAANFPEKHNYIETNPEAKYIIFIIFIKNFLEDATIGDHQIRLDLLFAFLIQTRFASLHEKRSSKSFDSPVARGALNREPLQSDQSNPELKIDYEKLTAYVYNVHQHYVGFFKPMKLLLEQKEEDLQKELRTEVRIVNWKNRSLLDIKKNYRISHQKLNKVINKYLEVLRRPLSGLQSPVYGASCENRFGSEHLNVTLLSIQMLIEDVMLPSQLDSLSLSAELNFLAKFTRVVSKMKEINKFIGDRMLSKYVDNLADLERVDQVNKDAISTFGKHNVNEVTIKTTDKAEVKNSKQKMCRQIYHTKKFALQSIFKNLQESGLSHQRGSNRESQLDHLKLSMEPLRGMLQRRNSSVLMATSKLVDDDFVISCEDNFLKLITMHMILMPTTKTEDLTNDQWERIKGYSLDMVMDITRHKRNASLIYKHLIDIQGAAMRLQTLLNTSSEATVNQEISPIKIYNQSKFRSAIEQFNEFISRCYLSICKLEKVASCCSVASSIEADALNMSTEANPELSTLIRLIGQTSDDNCMMTRQQLIQFRNHIGPAKKAICQISQELRDMLNYSHRSHLYSDDDIEHLDRLYSDFHESFSSLISSSDDQEGTFSSPPNSQPGTVLGSIRSLINEAEIGLKPRLSRQELQSLGEDLELHVNHHPNLKRLSSRLFKLTRQIKIAIQGVYRLESNFVSSENQIRSESDRRNQKPFNFIDSCKLIEALRPNEIARLMSCLFKTLNRSEQAVDISPIVHCLAPVLYIYTQDVASYLNVLLSSIHVKMDLAYNVIFFFQKLTRNGFGLPYKLDDLNDETANSARPSNQELDDNAGFGEGQGDTDVSKRLEFESQLDELQKPGDELSNNEKAGSPNDDNDEVVDAHDDAVEMGADFEGEARGPDDSADQQQEEEPKKEDKESEDDAELDDLDRVLDRVDRDEGQLDQQIWEDIDEDKFDDEDDEQDLRETEADDTLRPRKEDVEMAAKDSTIGDSNERREEQNELPTQAEQEMSDKQPATTGKEVEETEESVVPEEEQVRQETGPGASNDSADQDAPEAEDENEESIGVLDLEEEASLATERQKNLDSSNAENKSNDDRNSEDMSLESDEHEDDNSDAADSLNQQDDTSTAAKEDGELSGSESSISGASQICESQMDIADKLESDFALRRQAERLDSPIEKSIKNQSANMHSDQSNQGDKRELQGRCFGQFTIYDVLPDDDEVEKANDETLDEADMSQPDGIGNQPGSGGQQAEYSNSRGPEECRDSQQQQSGDQGDGQHQQKRAHSKDDDDGAERDTPASSSSATKRSIVSRDDEFPTNHLKRQKILDARDSEPDDANDNENVTETRNQSLNRQTDCQVRHVAGGSINDDNLLEVVDVLPDASKRTLAENQLLDDDVQAEGDTCLRQPSKGQQEPPERDDAQKGTAGEKLAVECLTEPIGDSDMSEYLSPISSYSENSEPNKLRDLEEPNDEPTEANEKRRQPSDQSRLQSSYNTNFGLLKYISHQAAPSSSSAGDSTKDGKNPNDPSADIMRRIDEALQTTTARGHESVDTDRLTNLWLDCTKKTNHLVHELCQQLQTVLTPTKLSKYKGDYKTGKRLNMRKIISYIASHYRRDKIWLRRTKPSKRTYNISLAVDNSSSMNENNCRLMTFQSLALLAKSLSLIEAGELSVSSFGQQVNCIHEFGQPYMDAIGAQWLRSLRFDEKRTSYSQLLEYSCRSFEKQIQQQQARANLSNTNHRASQLLIIISDGRNISSEEAQVKLHLRRLKQMGVLTLFIIIDDYKINDGKSIVDIKRCGPYNEDKTMTMYNYMELFPFPFYLILRHIETMPSILGDALRQWFELVSN